MPEAALVGCCVCCAAVCGDCSKGGLEEVNSCLYCHDAEQRDKQRVYRQFAEPSDPIDVSEPRSPRQRPAHAPHHEPHGQRTQAAAALALSAPGGHDVALPAAASVSPTAEQLLREQLAAQRQRQQQTQFPLADAPSMEEEL